MHIHKIIFQFPLTYAAHLLASQLTERVEGEGARHRSSTGNIDLTTRYANINKNEKNNKNKHYACVKIVNFWFIRRIREILSHVALIHELPIHQHARLSYCRAQQSMAGMYLQNTLHNIEQELGKKRGLSIIVILLLLCINLT